MLTIIFLAESITQNRSTETGSSKEGVGCIGPVVLLATSLVDKLLLMLQHSAKICFPSVFISSPPRRFLQACTYVLLRT
jgi:hypothetical protein